MKILVLANSDIGLYKFRKELLQELQEQGNEIYISLPDGENIERLKNMGCIFINTTIDRRGIDPIKDFFLMIKYFMLIRKIKPDKVITYTIKPNIYGGIISRILNVQYFANITGLGTAFQNEGVLKKITILLYKTALKKAETVFFENRENMKVFTDENICAEERCVLLSGAGVNLEEYCFCPYPKEQNKIRFLFIGRIMKEKGMDELLYAAKKIKVEYPSVEFDIIGFCEESYEDLLREQAEKGVINFYGYCDDVKPYIENCHCFVLPSYHEGMANTLLESGAKGRPLIVSDIHGCKEAIEDGKTGFLCDCMDKEDLYKKIKQFIELPYKEKEAMALASYKHISQNFDKRDVVKKTIERLSD